jgi:acetate kinase
MSPRPAVGAPILALNSGSSSLKFGLYRVGPAGLELLVGGEVISIAAANSRFEAWDGDSQSLCSETLVIPDHQAAADRIVRLLSEAGGPLPLAVGHRIVHGGPRLRRHVAIDGPVLGSIEAAARFAPLHTPAALSVIRVAQSNFPLALQVACFDTSFHADLPDVASTLPIPRELRAEGIQRFGFHGLSCESIVQQIGAELPDRLIIAHLGSGSSITAVKGGRSIDTSMGLTPSGGVIMGARTGDIDPGVLIHLMRERGLDGAAVEQLVNRRSGLLGISGLSSDMRVLLAATPSNPDADLAVRMFCGSIRKQLAAMITVLDGADLIVFTGAIGENSAQVRAEICGGLSWIGISLDDARNRSAADPLSAPASRCPVRALASLENEQIARHCWAMLAAQ